MTKGITDELDDIAMEMVAHRSPADNVRRQEAALLLPSGSGALARAVTTHKKATGKSESLESEGKTESLEIKGNTESLERKGDIDGRLATAKVRAKEAASAEAGAHKSLKSLAAERAATIAK